MFVAELLQKAQKDNLRTEMEIFLSYLLDCNRLDLVAFGEKQVPVEKLGELHGGWAKLKQDYPVAYLVGQKEFYGLNLFVTEDVLVPRGETELLVDLVLEKGDFLVGAPEGSAVPRVLELGTGSGAITVALAKQRPGWKFTATDVSEAALAVANKNFVQKGVDVKTFHADLLHLADEGSVEVLPGDYDILVANLPYIGTEEHDFLADNVRDHEPHLALFGGSDGLQLYRRLFEQIQQQGRSFKWILGEIGFSQGQAIEVLCKELLPEYAFELKKDLQALDRHFVLTLLD